MTTIHEMGMDCELVRRAEVAERYVAGQLTEAERESFERHYFECGDCFGLLQTLAAVRTALEQESGAAGTGSHARRRAPWIWGAVAAAAVIATSIGLWRLQPARPADPTPAIARGPAPGGTPAPSDPSVPEASNPAALMARLARVEPPEYVPPTLRSAAGDADLRFRQAMEPYARGDYDQAADGLEEASALYPDAANISFFLAISYLMSDRPEAAITSLERTLATGHAAYAEEARFYLAKAHLAAGDAPAAERELQRLVQAGSARAGDARDLLRAMEALP